MVVLFLMPPLAVLSTIAMITGSWHYVAGFIVITSIALGLFWYQHWPTVTAHESYRFGDFFPFDAITLGWIAAVSVYVLWHLWLRHRSR